MLKLEQKVLNGLQLIGYNGAMLQKPQLQKSIEEGPKNVEYTQLVNFLTNEIRTLQNIDEIVNVITSAEDSVAFVMEITSFLKELGCPFSSLTHGLVSDRLIKTEDKLLLLDYLITELMAARILQEKKPDKTIELKLQETPQAADMRQILKTLDFSKPPADFTLAQLFAKLGPKIQNILQKSNIDLVGNAIFSGFLSEQQWETLNGVQQDLSKEYKIRREMLLTRLDVTIQSFQWSDKTKGKEDSFEKIYTERRKALKVEPDVEIADLLAARMELAIIEKTSNSSVRKNTQSSLNKIIIGQVPDRGGRTSEQAPPPPEMPSWQQRTPGGDRGGRGGGRGGGPFNRGGGNYNRGGSSQSQSYSKPSYQNQTQSSYDSAGSYTVGQTYGGGTYDNVAPGGSYRSNERSGYSRGGQQDNSRGGYDNSSRSGAYDNSSRSGGYDNSGGNSYRASERRDSGGSYEQINKRAKTYDSFQANKFTYSEQYAEDSQRNQQYHPRGGRGRGRSNYSRGGNSSNYR